MFILVMISLLGSSQQEEEEEEEEVQAVLASLGCGRPLQGCKMYPHQPHV
jgi:hypothetical protein